MRKLSRARAQEAESSRAQAQEADPWNLGDEEPEIKPLKPLKPN